MVLQRPIPRHEAMCEQAPSLTRKIQAANQVLQGAVGLGVQIQQVGDGGPPVSRRGDPGDAHVLHNQPPPVRAHVAGSLRRGHSVFLRAAQFPQTL